MSPNPIEHSKELHKNPDYSFPSAYAVERTIKGRLELHNALKKTCINNNIVNFLDYGCGKNGLINLLKKNEDLKSVKFTGYDPAIDKFKNKPTNKFDIVTCIDVLEHISRSKIPQIFEEIDELTDGFFFFAIDLIPAKKTLSDHRNAHIMLAPSDWWCQQISTQFSYTRFFQGGKFRSGEKFPVHLIGWATNVPQNQHIANQFFESIEVLSKDWILNDENYTSVQFI